MRGICCEGKSLHEALMEAQQLRGSFMLVRLCPPLAVQAAQPQDCCVAVAPASFVRNSVTPFLLLSYMLELWLWFWLCF